MRADTAVADKLSADGRRTRVESGARPDLEIALATCNDTVTLRLRGVVDIATCELLEAVLVQQAGTRTSCVRVDLAQVGFLDCAGLGVLERTHRRLDDHNGLLVLTGVSPRLARLLALTHLNEVLFVAKG